MIFMDTLRIDKYWIKKIYINGMKNNRLIDKLKNNNISINTGIIVYNPIEEAVILGTFKNTLDYCHFGGGKKKYETIYQSAIRELKEESLNCIDIKEDIINSCPCIISYDIKVKKFCYIVFIVAMNVNINKLQNEFNVKKNNIENLEITNIVKVNLNDFYRLLDDSLNDYKIKNINFDKNRKEYKLYDNLKELIVKDDSKKKIDIKEIFRYVKDKKKLNENDK